MKKMRIFLFFLSFFSLAGTALMAQAGRYGSGPDSTECLHRLSFYYEYFKTGDYTSALPHWRIVLAKCPRTTLQRPFQDGQTMIKSLLQQPGLTAQRQTELIDSLYLMYDIRIEYYPDYSVSALQNKIREMGTYTPDAMESRLSELERLISMTGDNTIPEMLSLYMGLVVNLYAENKRADVEVMDTYSRLMAMLEQQEKSQPDDEKIKSGKLMIEDMFIGTGVATCENLITLFTPRFDENPNDARLVSTIASLLTYSECTSSDLYFRTVTSLHKLSPSYQTAYYLSKMHSSRNEFDVAIRYLQEAIDSEDIPDIEKGKCFVEQGILYFTMNNSNRAMTAARAAAESSATLRGRAYLLMSRIWAGQKCGENEIEQRAPFWVAVDYATKAKAADSSLAEEADKLIVQFRQYFPLQEDAFMYDLMEGSSYTVVCGSFRENTTVRTRNR